MSETPTDRCGGARLFRRASPESWRESTRGTRFGSRLSMIYVGKSDAATARKFADAIVETEAATDSVVHYEEGDPASGILAGARKLSTNFLSCRRLAGEADPSPVSR